MGKTDEEERRGAGDPSSSGSAAGNAGRCRCSRCGRVVQLRCVAALVLGVAVLLSAVFWLPPFFGRRGHPSGLDLDADIVASFRLHRTVAELNENISKLEFDIFEEIGVPNSSVVVSSLEPLARSNWTTVVFGVWPYPKDSTLSSTLISILKSSFMSLVAKQSTLHLTTSLFGNSSFFEVLKFPGGITIIPSQSAFLLQKPHAFFNFTLNFPIYKVEEKINELKDQMKLGLFLNSYENLYVKLTNLNGSTVAPPTIVQTSIVLEVGNHQPSLPRLKQLAQTISNSSSGNLGLNHTLFGKVKQIHLSSYLQHSLNTGGSTGSPSPAPEPLHHFHHHHHHRHHHHGSRDDKYLAPAPQPSYQTPAPAPAPAPTGSQFRRSSKPKKNDFHSPAAAPAATQRHSAAHVASPPPSVAPVSVPQSPYIPNVHEKPPAPAPPLLSSSPLPSVYFAHGQPPGESATRTMPPAGMPSSPEHYPSASASGPHLVHYWVTASFLYLLMNSL